MTSVYSFGLSLRYEFLLPSMRFAEASLASP